MYKLFYAPNSASMGVQALFEELDVAYELIQTTIDRNESYPAERMAINPNGWLPVMAWEGGSMYECAAITMFLCDRHPAAKLAPDLNSPSRSLYLQTLVYFSNSVQNAFQLSYYPDRFADNTENEASAQRRGNSRLRETWKVVDDQIGDNKWLLGEHFSAADIYLYMLTTWLDASKGHPAIDEFPNVARIASSAVRRPSIHHVFIDKG